MQRIFNPIRRISAYQPFAAASLRAFASTPQPNPFDAKIKTAISHAGQDLHYYKLPSLNDSRICKYFFG